mmetsp:Transcript_1997/g.7185  ORF Transcript_1997/g.7185 Transcript_1997/m.7185 type:complete len:319 (+) Transcript_1997:1767-2723(+)
MERAHLPTCAPVLTDGQASSVIASLVVVFLSMIPWCATSMDYAQQLTRANVTLDMLERRVTTFCATALHHQIQMCVRRMELVTASIIVHVPQGILDHSVQISPVLILIRVSLPCAAVVDRAMPTMTARVTPPTLEMNATNFHASDTHRIPLMCAVVTETAIPPTPAPAPPITLATIVLCIYVLASMQQLLLCALGRVHASMLTHVSVSPIDMVRNVSSCMTIHQRQFSRHPVILVPVTPFFWMDHFRTINLWRDLFAIIGASFLLRAILLSCKICFAQSSIGVLFSFLLRTCPHMEPTNLVCTSTTQEESQASSRRFW